MVDTVVLATGVEVVTWLTVLTKESVMALYVKLPMVIAPPDDTWLARLLRAVFNPTSLGVPGSRSKLTAILPVYR